MGQPCAEQADAGGRFPTGFRQNPTPCLRFNKVGVAAMPWWLDLVLLGAAVLLWAKGTDTPDDVWSVFQKFLAFVAVVVVLLGGRQVLLEALVLAITFWLPRASQFDEGPLDRRG
jgi:hypothetical protein